MKEKEILIVGVDFDQTIANTTYPVIHNLKKDVLDVLEKWRNQGIFIQIHSCRNGFAEMEMETFLFENKIPYNSINDHAPWIKQEFFNPHHPISRKLFHHILIDDTSLDWMLNGHPGWRQIDEDVQNVLKNNKEKFRNQPNFNFDYSTNLL